MDRIQYGGHHGGHSTWLFYTGANAKPSSSNSAHHPLANVRIRKVADGQFYHLVAHDPLLRHGFAAFADNPRLRWRRIGVPGLAALLSFGFESAIDPWYVAIELGFVFAGVFWLARFAQSAGRGAAWGLAFLVVPATMVSLDRMTVDIAPAALVVAAIFQPR